MAREYSILGIIQTLKKWKKQIIITTILVAILSLIITLFMPDYYKSTALAYPASEDLSKPIPLVLTKGQRIFMGIMTSWIGC